MTQPDEDVIGASSQFFGISEPQDQQNERKTEEAKVYSALPIIKEVIEHFDLRIAARDSIKSIDIDISEDPELHQKTCAVNTMLADALREEKQLLESLLDGIEK